MRRRATLLPTVLLLASVRVLGDTVALLGDAEVAESAGKGGGDDVVAIGARCTSAPACLVPLLGAAVALAAVVLACGAGVARRGTLAAPPDEVAR